MGIARGHEIPTIDVVLITITVPDQTDELALNTASQIQVTPEIETNDPVRLIIKGVLRAQKPAQNVLTGNTIVITDNVFNAELVRILQGGIITKDEETGRIESYSPPVTGSTEIGEIFTLNAYSAIYNAAGIITGYEKIMYPNCRGIPLSISAEDDVFRVSEYTINSAPDMGQAPYKIDWILPEELPIVTINPNEPPVSPVQAQMIRGFRDEGEIL